MAVAGSLDSSWTTVWRETGSTRARAVHEQPNLPAVLQRPPGDRRQRADRQLEEVLAIARPGEIKGVDREHQHQWRRGGRVEHPDLESALSGRGLPMHAAQRIARPVV